MDKPGLINELLPKVMADIGEIAKLRRNTQGSGYNFRGIDDALNHVNPALVKHGVSASVKVHDLQSESWDRDGKAGVQRVYRVTLIMDLTFTGPDGSQITNSTCGEAIDYGGDKASSKAMSNAMKYGLFFGLCLPVERQDIEDGDDDHRDEGSGPIRSPSEAARARSAPPASGPPKEAAKKPFTLEIALEAIGKVTTTQEFQDLYPRIEARIEELSADDQAKITDALNDKSGRLNGRIK